MKRSVFLNEDQRDGLQEIVNVAMGRAGDSLARFLEVFIQLSVPNIDLVDADAIHGSLERLVNNDGHPVSAVRQGFNSSQDAVRGLRGEAIVVYSNTNIQELGEMMSYDEDDINDEAEQELLLDITNIINGVCLTGISDQLGVELSFSAPSLIGQQISLKEVLPKSRFIWSQALLIEINYTLEKSSFQCNLLLLMPDDAVEVIKDTLNNLLNDE